VDVDLLALGIGSLLAAGIGASLLAGRLRLPGLVLVLVLGMVIGSDGLSLIEFGTEPEDFEPAQTAAILALALILYEGGLSSGWAEIKPVIRVSVLLAIVGTMITAGITAIVASDSLIALSVFRVAKAMGRSIPRDLSLVAFDDADWTGATTPAITVMAQPIHEIGAEAARLLIRRIGGDGAPRVTRVLDQHLIERESVAPPRR